MAVILAGTITLHFRGFPHTNEYGEYNIKGWVPLHNTSGGFLTLQELAKYYAVKKYHYITLPGVSSHFFGWIVHFLHVVPLHYTSGGFLTPYDWDLMRGLA